MRERDDLFQIKLSFVKCASDNAARKTALTTVCSTVRSKYSSDEGLFSIDPSLP